MSHSSVLNNKYNFSSFLSNNGNWNQKILENLSGGNIINFIGYKVFDDEDLQVFFSCTIDENTGKLINIKGKFCDFNMVQMPYVITKIQHSYYIQNIPFTFVDNNHIRAVLISDQMSSQNINYQYIKTEIIEWGSTEDVYPVEYYYNQSKIMPYYNSNSEVVIDLIKE